MRHFDSEYLKIPALCIGAAVIYGICHDQVTTRVCIEYFTIGHPPVFDTQSPTYLAFGWGVIATWWVGAILGAIAAPTARMGAWPKLTAWQVAPCIGALLGTMAVAALLAGLIGYWIASAYGIQVPNPIGDHLAAEKHAPFIADYCAHCAAYVVGFIGGLIVTLSVLVTRSRLKRIR